jgi:prefoldin subunit 5
MLNQVDEQIKTLEAKRDYLKKQVKQDEDALTELTRQVTGSRGTN